MVRLHELQENVLKKEIREMERRTKREGANLEYLKNVVIKYMAGGDHEVLLSHTLTSIHILTAQAF
jgi:hypothetical protein